MRRFLCGWLVIGVVSAGARQPGATDRHIPPDLQKIRISATGSLSSAYALVHLFSEDGFKGYALVESSGRIAWHYRTRDYPFAAVQRTNRNFVFMDKGYGLVEVDRTGAVIHELRQRDPERELHHALAVTPRDTILYLAFDTEDFAGKRLKGEAIWEWTPETGEDVRRWRSWDHLSPALDRSARTAGAWLHGNSLAIGSGGNILLSLHYLDQVISIAPDWASLQWRLGGVRPTIQVPPDQRFSAQHTASETTPNTILMFDNRTDLAGRYSRAVEFALAGRVARPVWQWRPPKDNYSSAVSSAVRMANGHTLVAFGMSAGRNGSTGPTEAFEVNRDGHVVWHLVVEGVMTMFRVEPIRSFEP
ncbi:MAG: aryl-sulfate sulfotransferase [Acidobacteriota bacterium]